VRVFGFVEGPADRVALGVLFDPIIEQGQANGVGIRFLPLGGKSAVLNDAGRKAADHLSEEPEDWVIAIPDLYPMSVFDGTPNAHRSFAEMRQILIDRFQRRASERGLSAAVANHFRVHCLKHDLEVLLLAAPNELKQRLKTQDALRRRWRAPVEDQNDGQPPKRVVEALFDQYRKKPRYEATVDAPWILKRASLDMIVRACPQHCAPLEQDLRRLAMGEVLD